ncbi:DUF6512 family protein [Alkaliphilus transvaalensis]|uniref:DUF6512 family protein n=1 Tax=Alkaliphilus transvaalensis TaxID=114628 RepID=UPI00047D636C|nr:DUF6512 family protein [Alkaliphilus transvaalensis]
MLDNLFKWEVAGVVVIFILSFLLHEAYDLSGNNPIVALFAPINESIWEHMKMAAFAVFFFSIIEYLFIRHSINNFFLAKGLLIFIIPIMVALLNIAYMAVLGKHMVLIDITGLFIWITLGQLMSYKLLSNNHHFTHLNNIFLVGASLMLMVYIIFTYIPPNLGIFKEHSNETL